ncbi:MAG: hypothetical protein ACYC0V_09355 [Armatimonadota bacterium]
MMKSIRCQILSTLTFLLLLTAMCVPATWAQELVSANPRYMSIVLPEFGGKGVAVIFDESAGTGQGFDTVYVDANLDGTIGADERFTADPDKIVNNMMSPLASVDIMPTGEMPAAYTIAFQYAQVSKHDFFSASVTRNMESNGRTWSFEYSGEVVPSKIKDKPQLYKPVAAPKPILKAGPYGRATGVVAALKSGLITIASPDITVDLQVKNAAGKVIREDKGSLDKYGFG